MCSAAFYDIASKFLLDAEYEGRCFVEEFKPRRLKGEDSVFELPTADAFRTATAGMPAREVYDHICNTYLEPNALGMVEEEPVYQLVALLALIFRMKSYGITADALVERYGADFELMVATILADITAQGDDNLTYCAMVLIRDMYR